MAEKQIIEGDNVSVEIQINRNVVVISIIGEVTTRTVGPLNKMTKPIVDQIKNEGPFNTLIVDFKQVPFLDSGGVGFISGKFISLKKLDKSFVICSLNNAIRDTLRYTQLEGVFNIFDNRRDALANFLVTK